ncbi:hypothetical protein VPH35_031858 [Triticum aestivum]
MCQCVRDVLKHQAHIGTCMAGTCKAELVECVAAVLEGVHVAAEERHVGVHAAVAQEGRQQDEQALHRQVAGHEEERPAASEVHVVERDPQPAVDLDVGAQHHLNRIGRRQQPLLLHSAGVGEVDERLEVAIVDPGHRPADELHRVLHRPGHELPRRGGGPRPEDDVAGVSVRHLRAHPRSSVHRDGDAGGLPAIEPARLGHAAPQVRHHALQGAARPGCARRRLRLEPRDELPAEVHLVDHHLVVFVVAVPTDNIVVHLLVGFELDATVLVLDVQRFAGMEEGSAVVHRDGVDGGAAGGLAPGDEEVAGGAAVGHDVLRGEPHDERPAREARDLDQHQLLGPVVAAGVQAEHLRRGLERHDAVERHVGRRLHEPRAGVVEHDRAFAVGVHAEPPGPLAVVHQRPGQPGLEDGVGRRRCVERVYHRDVRVEVGLVEHGELDDVVRAGRSDAAGAVVGVDGLGRVHGDLHVDNNVK